MNAFYKLVLFMFLITAVGNFSTADGQSRKIKKAEAKAEKKKEQQKKDFLVSQEKDKKRRYEMQSPETKKQMKDNKKRAKRINSQNHTPFLKRLFHSKKR
jgi:hypothetical protein